jgi:hypothetical protein
MRSLPETVEGEIQKRISGATGIIVQKRIRRGVPANALDE